MLMKRSAEYERKIEEIVLFIYRYQFDIWLSEFVFQNGVDIDWLYIAPSLVSCRSKEK